MHCRLRTSHLPLVALILALGLIAVPCSAKPTVHLSALGDAISLEDCSCTAAAPDASNLQSCQSVTGAFGCTPGTCGTYEFCLITGSVSTSSACPGDLQLCVVSGVTVCQSGTSFTIPGGNTPIACGTFLTVTIQFCSSAYPLACTATGWWTQNITCTSCLD
jgi:hypothetical protein